LPNPRSEPALPCPLPRPLVIRHLGTISYAEGLSLQEDLVTKRQRQLVPDTLLLLEHQPVFTLGRNARAANVLLPVATLRARGFDVFETGRGGDVTYHGPGQVVGYPIFDLTPDRCDVHRYVRDLEEVMIRTCADFGVQAGRVTGLTGVWVNGAKVGAIGVRISRWVTSHGFALNVLTDLVPFGLIVPCGLRDKPVTRLADLAPAAPAIEAVYASLARHVAAVFDRAPFPQPDPAQATCDPEPPKMHPRQEDTQ
jgi:lipoyl(octanoyl) transferase